ncbi:MAG: transglutaminase domain-containing protein [Spirochaetia bacterium]
MNWIKTVLRTAAVILLSAVLPVLIILMLNPQGPFVLLGLYLGFVILLFTLHRYGNRLLRIISAVSLFMTGALGIFVIFTDIVITPYSAYLIWFDLARQGKASGSISFLYLMTASFFSVFLAGSTLIWGYFRPLSALIFVSFFLCALIFQTPVWYILAGCTMLIMFLSFNLSRRRSYQEEKGSIRGTSFRGGAIVIILSLLVVIPFIGKYEPRGSNLIDSKISPGFREMTLNVFPNFPLLYSIPGYGYSFNEKKLGGKPLLSEQPIFTVTGKGGETVYLRTHVYDTYIDDAWYLSDSAEDLGKAEAEAASIISHQENLRGSPRNDVTIQVKNEFFSYIPHTLNTGAMTVYRDDEPVLTYADKSTGYLLKSPLVRNDGVGLIFSERKEAVDTIIDLEDTPYLQVPRNITDNIRFLAERLSGGDESETVKNILNYLKYSYAYSLSPPGTAAESTFLDEFLFKSGTGYCVHFTTAFIILSRLNGIPARYISGFLVYIPSETGEKAVSGLSAHAWPEVFYRGDGWTGVEATPPLDPDLYMDPSFYMEFELFNESLTSRQLSNIIGDRVSRPAAEEPIEKGTRRNFVIGIILISIGILAVIFLIYQLFRFIKRNKLFAFTPAKRYQAGLSRILKITHGAVAHPAEIGWMEWKKRTMNRYPGASHVDKGVHDILNIYFGNQSIQQSNIETVQKIINELQYSNPYSNIRKK